uniref:Uncharacterized protein n=1 Tax=Ananas comosus var. bracteatus TaxID=296719 RepID=A0A6V7NWX1_ANACO|nr:unnamed protein product [Ananas comosus var. bracteatus]
MALQTMRCQTGQVAHGLTWPNTVMGRARKHQPGPPGHEGGRFLFASVLLPPSVAAFILPSWQRRSLSLFVSYGGGAALRAHFLCNSNETSEDLMDKEYPFAFMLASAWFVITILADCVVTIMVARGMRVERFQKRAEKDRRSW